MKKILSICSLPILLMTTQLSAGSLIGPEEPQNIPQRHNFLDYLIRTDEEGVSSTVQLQIEWAKPEGGSQHFLGTTSSATGGGGGELTEGGVFEFEKEWVPSFRGSVLFSDDESGQIFIVSGLFRERPTKTVTREPINAAGTMSLNIDSQVLNGVTQDVDTADLSSSSKLIAGFVGIQSYTLQYKDFGLAMNSGLYGESFKQTQTAAYTTAAETFNYSGDQKTFAAGGQISFIGSFILSSSDESAVFLSAESRFAGNIAYNEGTVIHSTNAAVDQHKNYALPEFTFMRTAGQVVSINYAAKPDNTENPSFFQLTAGASIETAFGRDLLSHVFNDVFEQVTTTPSVFLSFSYTS